MGNARHKFHLHARQPAGASSGEKGQCHGGSQHQQHAKPQKQVTAAQCGGSRFYRTHPMPNQELPATIFRTVVQGIYTDWPQPIGDILPAQWRRMHTARKKMVKAHP